MKVEAEAALHVSKGMDCKHSLSRVTAALLLREMLSRQGLESSMRDVLAMERILLLDRPIRCKVFGC
jgi:hypothetical protein